MRPIITTVLVIWLSLLGGVASALDAIENVISDQLEAFNDRDVPKAFTHASPMIKRIFGGPENFGNMVQRAFPMIWDNSSARFLELREEGGAIFQRVLIHGEDGIAYLFDYKMIETSEGWQIDGVALFPAPDVAA